MPQIEGFSHVSLSVTDQQRSARWYEEVFGFVTFDKLDEPDYAESVLLHPQRRHPLRPAAPRQPRHPFDPARTGGDTSPSGWLHATSWIGGPTGWPSSA